jgi:phosphatidylglycerophosphatase A
VTTPPSSPSASPKPTQSGEPPAWGAKLTFVDQVARFLGTGAFSGYSPIAPGTAGTVVAIPLVAAMAHWGGTDPLIWVVSVIVVTVLAVWSAHRCVALFGQKDPSRVTADEVAGFFVTMAFLPVTPVSLGVGFLFFRLFDIVKPEPARSAEGFAGGWGVVADDLVAGVYANIATRITLAILGGWLVAT